MKVLPFDARNERDFDEMTRRILAGLELIRKSRALKPTQNTLADVAKCSRRTLSLRKWPIEELRKIKKGEASTKQGDSSASKRNNTTSLDGGLVKQLKNYQTQNAALYDRLQEREEEKSRDASVISALENQVISLKEEISKLKAPRRGGLRVV